MKTRILIAMCVLACLCLTACGSHDIISGYNSGDVKLGQYKEVTYDPQEVVVTDEEIREKVEAELINKHEQNVDVEGKTVVEEGDLVICDYTGYMDGEQFDGGSTTDAEIQVGASGMIPGFMEGFIGAEIGVEKEFDVTFPDPYEVNPDLAGKPATFKIIVHRIVKKELPQYTDEIVQKYSEYKTTAEYDESVRASITEEKQKAADTKKKYDIMLKIIRACEFDERALAPHVIENRERLLSDSDKMYQQYLGVDSYSYYTSYLQMSDDEFNEYYDSLAKMQTEYTYVLAAVADKENLTATDDEINELAEKMRESYGYETLDDMYASFKSTYNEPARDVVASQVKLNKALELITSTALPN